MQYCAHAVRKTIYEFSYKLQGGWWWPDFKQNQTNSERFGVKRIADTGRNRGPTRNAINNSQL